MSIKKKLLSCTSNVEAVKEKKKKEMGKVKTSLKKDRKTANYKPFAIFSGQHLLIKYRVITIENIWICCDSQIKFSMCLIERCWFLFFFSALFAGITRWIARWNVAICIFHVWKLFGFNLLTARTSVQVGAQKKEAIIRFECATLKTHRRSE